MVPTQDVSERPWPIGGGDVLLVTGGGKGIAAECALGLGRATGASVALLGRSDPAADKELSENIARIRAAGVRCCYVRADVTDGPGVCNAVARVEQSLGPITAVLHGAGTNTPRLIESLDLQAFRATLVPKTAGLANVLAAFDPNRLRLLITFSSIIARAGLRGEADYATANEWLTACTEKFQKQHPSCRCLAIEWSVWSGVGMGERLGRVDSLIQQGIMPISPDEGVRMLLELVKRPSAAVAQIVTGRFGEPPTLRLHEPELPLCRFLERRRVYYPGVELIVDADLSREADLYLDDHILQKQRLFPAVLGLEAMAQAAMALAGSSRPPSFEKVEFNRPVSVPDKGSTTIRLAALRRGQGIFEVCLRSEETDYHIDHFRALCRFQGAGSNGVDRLSLPNSGAEFLELNLEEHLYGRLLFHGRRFRRLCGYRWLNAVECAAEIGPGENTRWFGPYLPENFVLGDPAVRDAALHAIQACIPHQRILPTGVDRAWIGPAKPGVRVVQARQRERDGNSFVYDMEVTSPEGEILEHWEGLRLRAVEPIASPEAWPLPLLAPYLGRRLEELAGSYSIRVMLENNGGKDRSDGSASRRAAGRNHSPQRVLGHTDRIWRRPDGKPVIGNGNGISASHSHGLTLAVGGSGDVACDLERVVARSSAAWHDLLGKERSLLADRVSRECAEEADTARTRLWTAIECLKKAGLPLEAPLLLDSVTEDGWVVLRSGRLTIATCATAVCGSDKRIIVGVALSSRDETEISPAVPAGI
jgi:enediyne polyketide synthase